MKSHVAALTLLGRVAASPSDVLDGDDASLRHATYCVTYESTYLVPVSFGTNDSEISTSRTDRPEFISSGSTTLPLFTPSEEVAITVTTINTEQPLSPTNTTTALPTLVPTGQRVILLVAPSGEITKRDVGGFVGNGNPDVCTFATVFTLGQGRLFDGNFPVSYSEEEFQPLSSSSSPVDNAVTTTFSSEGGVLGFSNPSLPDGRASFCQTPSDGQVYITYSSIPFGCVFVTLTIYEAHRCINGKIDGLDITTDSLTQSESAHVTIPPFTETDLSKSPETEFPAISESGSPYDTDNPTIIRTSDAAEIVFPTLSIPSTRSRINQTSLVSSTASFEEENPLSTEDQEPTSRFDEVSTSEDFTNAAASTTIATFTILSATTVTESPTTTSPGDAESTTVEGSDLNSSTTLITSLESTTTDSTSTRTETTTTTEEPALVARSVTRNGRFAMSDPNSADSVEGWETEGNAIQSYERCYRDDGSTDNGCVTFTVSRQTETRRKRATVSASISQDLTGLDPLVTHTIQFYYLVTGTSSTGSCKVTGRAGFQSFYTGEIVFSEPSVPWERAVGTVTADVTEAPLTISLSCTGGGEARIIVDSVFASNEVTPSNIDEYELDYGDDDN
ncbi:hypothetical protein FSPOR_9172 [Fusarium sporotrichioides]|uniref:DUF7908 domain-containing protein n=1 Tax=Fusarium sporotrichioides TaxID=5514 RepID=A0A395RRA8_FUSSP|nr:hypothetical protein FSPOR_9172 [Fusarium sporotrichioides]